MNFEEWLFAKLWLGTFERRVNIKNKLEKFDFYKTCKLFTHSINGCVDILKKYTLFEIVVMEKSTLNSVDTYIKNLKKHKPTFLMYREYADVDSKIKIEIYHN